MKGCAGPGTPVSLSGQAARSRTQEPEIPVEDVEKQPSDAHRPDEGRGKGPFVKMSRNGEVHHAHERHGDIGQDARNGKAEYFAVESFHRNLVSSSSMPR